MNGYLGETSMRQQDSPYKDHKPADWAMLFIEKYGQIDGAHHKTWVIDQVARILLGTPMMIFKASWEDGTVEYRFRLSHSSYAYDFWVKKMKGDDEYDYNEGVPP